MPDDDALDVIEARFLLGEDVTPDRRFDGESLGLTVNSGLFFVAENDGADDSRTTKHEQLLVPLVRIGAFSGIVLDGEDDSKTFAIDARTNPGYSGSPVFFGDSADQIQILGVVTSLLSERSSSIGTENQALLVDQGFTLVEGLKEVAEHLGWPTRGTPTPSEVDSD